MTTMNVDCPPFAKKPISNLYPLKIVFSYCANIQKQNPFSLTFLDQQLIYQHIKLNIHVTSNKQKKSMDLNLTTERYPIFQNLSNFVILLRQ
jgi:hypothetical protein